MKAACTILLAFLLVCCGDKKQASLPLTPELLQGTWQFFDADSMYTELEVSDSLYFYVYTPMKILRVEPVAYSLDTSQIHLLYDDGELWKSYTALLSDSSTLVLSNEEEGTVTCKRIYPIRKISAWKPENKALYDSLFLSRKNRISR